MTVAPSRLSANHWPGLHEVPSGPRTAISARVARGLEPVDGDGVDARPLRVAQEPGAYLRRPEARRGDEAGPPGDDGGDLGGQAVEVVVAEPGVLAAAIGEQEHRHMLRAQPVRVAAHGRQVNFADFGEADVERDDGAEQPLGNGWYFTKTSASATFSGLTRSSGRPTNEISRRFFPCRGRTFCKSNTSHIL